ncbi:hypothetical protein KAR91_23800 [Candidatus Pacearchaeota archaeon]|nr:hypothetical protein [Candidatus Pacearchaeota archaeon]
MASKHDATTKEGVKKQEDAAQRYRLRQLSDLAAVLRLPEGNRFIKELLGACFEYQTTYDRSATSMAYNEGRRSLMLDLKADLGELVIRRLMSVEELTPFILNLPEEEQDGQ